MEEASGKRAGRPAKRQRSEADHARSTERALDLIVGVTAVASAAEASDLELVCLNKICALRRWQFGQVWYPDASDEFLKYSGDSRHGHQQFAEFHEISRSMPLRRGDDLPGRVWKTKSPVWAADLVEYGNMPRAEAAPVQGFKTALAFPVILDNEVLAVFEFFSTGRHLPDRTSVDAFHKLEKFLGDVFVRKRTQTELRTSEERWRSLLDSPIFGVTFLDENQRFISSNQAYRTMTGYSNEELRQLTPLDISVPGEPERQLGAGCPVGDCEDIKVYPDKLSVLMAPSWFMRATSLTRSCHPVDASGLNCATIGTIKFPGPLEPSPMRTF